MWPLRGSGTFDAIVVVVVAGALVSLAPVAVLLLRRRFGAEGAGPLWPLLAFVLLGSFYAIVTPPWQTPDEPQHMVHVEVVRRAGLSAPTQLLPGAAKSPEAVAALIAADRAVVASMRKSDASRWLPGAAEALDAGETPGPREFAHPRLYYAVAGVLTKPLAGAGVLGRLAVLRAFGIFLGAVSLWACGAAGRLLWPRQALAEAPLVIALAIPTFVAFAGSVNNDGLAIACASLLIVVLLAGVLDRSWVARPVPWFVSIAVLVGAGVATKRTFIPLVVLVVFGVAIRYRHRRVFLATGITVLAVVAVSFAASWSPRLALWDRQTTELSYRCRDPAGAWAICMPTSAPSIIQHVPLARARKLEGTPLALTFAARASEPGANAVVEVKRGAEMLATRSVQLGDTPQPVLVPVMGPDHIDDLSVVLYALGRGGVVFVRDLRLAAANDPHATNQVQNGSGEVAVAGPPSFLPQSVAGQVMTALDAAARFVHSPGAVAASVPLVWNRMATAFGMFWGTIGWQLPPPLFPAALNWLLAALVLIGIVGAAFGLLRRSLPQFGGGLLLLGAMLVTVLVVFRDLPPSDDIAVSGRYVFPGIVAFAVILAAGWRYFFPGPDADFRLATRFAVPVLHGLFLALVFIPWLLR